MNCVPFEQLHARWAIAAARLARVYSETSMAAAELRRGSLEPNRASGQARHALRRAHIKAAAGDAKAIHNRNGTGGRAAD